MGMFDDLIPQASAPSAKGGLFDDLVPKPPEIDFSAPVADVRAQIAKLPEAQRAAALERWADTFVANERKGGGAGQYVGDMVRNFARGVPVLGAWADEANAATAAGLHTISGGRVGAPYDEAKAYQRSLDKAADTDTAKLGSVNLPVVGPVDVTGSGVTKLAGGLAAMPVTPVLRAMQGTTIIPRIVNSAATGGVIGAAHGAGEGDGLGGRIEGAVIGGGLGLGVGAAVPPIAAGISNTAQRLADMRRQMPPALAPYDRNAVGRVGQFAADDNVAQTAAQRARELGPEGMLGDLGDNLQAATAGLARTPGPGRTTVLDSLRARREAAPARITADVDQSLGPAANIPATLDATRASARQQAEPFRQQFRNAPVPYTQPLQDIFEGLGDDLGPVLRDARRLANLDPASGPRQFFAEQARDGSWRMTRVPNASEWDYIKRALDGKARSQDANDQRVFGHWARQVRETVDEALSPGNPQASPWARARAIEAEDFQLRDGVEAGRNAFSRGLSPDQMRADLVGMSAAERAGYGIGGRDQIRQIMGNSATAVGANGDTAARRLLGSDNAREKIELMAGRPAAESLIRRLDAETAFERTRNMADGNSITATMQAVQRRLPQPVNDAEVSRTTVSSSLTGLGIEGARRALNAMTGGWLNERNARIAADMARILTTQGGERDRVVGALVQEQLRQGNRQAAGRLLETHLRGAATVATIDDDIGLYGIVRPERREPRFEMPR